MDKYSSTAFRSFKTFTGELTAVAAGIFVGLKEAIPIIQGNEDSDPWKLVAEKHGIIVNGLTSKGVVDSSVRLNLVSLYSGFDLFMNDIRTAFNKIQGRTWIQHDGDTPFTALGRNTRSENDSQIAVAWSDPKVLITYFINTNWNPKAPASRLKMNLHEGAFAEGAGFEPASPMGLTTYQVAVFVHSTNLGKPGTQGLPRLASSSYIGCTVKKTRVSSKKFQRYDLYRNPHHLCIQSKN